MKGIRLDDLLEKCGNFLSKDEGDGYDCKHPQNTEGKCHDYCCPIAYCLKGRAWGDTIMYLKK